MLSSIKQFFDQFVSPETHAAEADQDHVLKVATAALLIEVMRIDTHIRDDEKASIASTLQRCFELDAEQLSALVALAENEAHQANDYYQFTSLINRTCSPDQKIRIIEDMWLVAMADGHLAAHELHLMRKVADLLHVGHADYVAAKQRARNTAQLPAG